MADQETVKLALLGCGEQVSNGLGPALAHYAGQNAGQVELTVVCGADPAQAEQVGKAFGFAAVSPDPASMFRDHSPHACVCALPAMESSLQVPQLLAQKTPCLLAMPMGNSLDDALEMSDAANEAETLHLVAMNRRSNPYLTRAITWAGQPGTIRSVDATMTRSGPLARELLWRTAVHAVDTVAFILGRISGCKRLAGDATDAKAGEHVFDLELPDELVGRLCLGASSEQDVETYELTGEGVRALVTVQGPDGPSLLCWRGDKLEVKIAPGQDRSPPPVDGTCEVVAEFVQFLRDKKTRHPTIEDVLPALDLTAQISQQIEAEA